jgi:RNA polymerase sigma factor (sigma-70 family)
MTTLTADAQLVSAYLDGDRTALASIYDKYAAGLYDTAAAMLSDRHDAADMVQDVFCIAAERLNQLRDPDRLKPWLYAVLRNEVYRRTKKRKRATPTDFQAETTPDVVAAFDPNADGAAASYDELAELVRSAAAGLDERDRLVLELSVRQGLTGTDLADALGVTPEQSYTLVHRMRDRIEKSLGAFTVAKMGSKECSELATIISGWNGEFSILIRKRVARHIDDCSICERTRSKYAPLALFGAAPVFVLPFGLREKVLAATQSIPTPSKSADTHASKGSRGSQRSHHIKLNRNDGFPRLVRISRHAVAVIASTAAVLLLIAGLVLIQQSKESGNEYGDVLSADPIVVDTSTPTEDSVATSSMVDSSLTTTPTTTIPTTNPTTTPGTDVPESETSIAAVSPPLRVTTTMSPAPATTPAVTATTQPTTTTARMISPLATSTNVLNFARGVRASLKLTNNNSTAIMWSLAESSGFFTFVPSSGSVGAGATLTVATTFARALASALPEGEFNLLAALTTRGAPNTALTLTGIVGQPPVIGTFTPYFSGLACSRLNIQVPITDESSIASVSAKVTYTNPQATPSTATLTATLNDSGKGVWVTSLTSIPQTVTQVVVKVTATDIYGFSSTSETRINRTNSC